MGRLINIFDTSVGMTGTKLLTEKTHRDRSPVCKGRPNVVKEVSDPNGVQIEGNPVANVPSKTSSDDISSRMAVKMFTSHEISKEMETGGKSIGVIARLMGLDALPDKQTAPVAPRGAQQNIHNTCAIAEAMQECQPQQGVFLVRTAPRNIIHHHEKRECTDVSEVWKQRSRTNHFKGELLSIGSNQEKTSEERMALVHQKFKEAKQLAKNQNLLQSKEFQDALEILHSNKGILAKFLKEPSLQFSRNLREKQLPTMPNEAKCIAMLKPSKLLDTSYEKQQKKRNMHSDRNGGGSGKTSWKSGSPTHSKSVSLSQSTRIVVLKPSPRQPHDLKTLLTNTALEGEDFFEEMGTHVARGSREMAKEVTDQMRENLSSNHREETLLSSILSNGCIGDESSFSRSEFMCLEEECGNFSDSQITTPTLHSWDYINRYSHDSISSYSHASCSSESSVIREAKKRLSERLAIVTSYRVNQEQKQPRSSSTLGEMLAASEILRDNRINEESFVSSGRLCSENYDPKTVPSCLSSERNQGENANGKSHRTLQRSESVTSSSCTYENVEADSDVSNSKVGQSVVLRETTYSKSVKFSLRGKVSSFFSRNKRSSQEKTFTFPLANSLDKVTSSDTTSVGTQTSGLSECVADYRPEEDEMHVTEESLSENLCSTSEHYGLIQGASFMKEAFFIEKPKLFEIPVQGVEQPSPVSVLDLPSEEDTSCCSSQSHDSATTECQRAICRPSLIESIACSLSWEDDVRTETTNLEKHPAGFLTEGLEERERLDFIKSLLLSSGLTSETSSMSLAKWHSSESLLDPLLLNKLIKRKENDVKCMENRSRQRLLFDSVNAALMEICTGVSDVCRHLTKTSSMDTNSVTDEVLALVAQWFSVDDALASGHSDNSLMVDCVIKKEICGRGWEEVMCLEITEIEREIERQVMEELVGESLDGFISMWLE